MSYTNGLDKPEEYFNTKLYSGNSSTQAITSVNFQPDFTWLKRRDQTSFHYLFDSIRGVQKRISSNSDTTEATVSTSLTSFDSNGFTLGSEGDVNESGGTYVGWNWLAGGTASSNTDGSITSNVSANTTSGFSIVSYTGTGSTATVGHGLGVAPSMIIIKARSAPESWTVYHKNLTSASYNLTLNDTSAETNNPSHFNSTAPTSSVFSIGTSGRVNVSSQTQIAYCFAEKKGFSKFGSYTGNGSTDGTFVYTGFKPAFILLKITNTYSDVWFIFDNKRDSFNLTNNRLIPNLNVTETTQEGSDFLSNGFKLRTTSTGTNASGANYIYMAFAENPFTTSTGIPTTAR